MTNTQHPFEAAGLGTSPFTFSHVTKNLWSPYPGAPSKPGSSCDYCATAITYEYWLKSADGKTFKVGCDCVQKTTGERDTLRVTVTKAHRALLTEQRQARAKAKREERQAAWKAEREQRMASAIETNKVQYADWLEFTAASTNDFVMDVRARVLSGAILTESMKTSTERVVRTEQAPKTYLADVGMRITIMGEVIRKTSFGSYAYNGPCSFLYVIDTPAGLASYLGTANVGQVGSKVSFDAKVKQHRVERDGRYVTSVARPTNIKVAS